VKRLRQIMASVVMIAAIVTEDPSCAPPEGGSGSGASKGTGGFVKDRGNQSLDCEIPKPSAPYVGDKPKPDGANFYSFNSRAEGDVYCTGEVAQIGVTVVFHYKTNDQQGAVSGSSNLCSDKSSCDGHAEYRRQRLYCHEVYHYDDYAQVTAWFKATAASPQTTISSKEGRHRTGSSYQPFGVGCR
jgi:hypothetical protein